MPHTVKEVRLCLSMLIAQEGLPLARRAWNEAEADARRKAADPRWSSGDTAEFAAPLVLTPLDNFPIVGD